MPLSLPQILSYKGLVDPFLLEQYKDSSKLRAILDLVMGMLDPVEIGLQELMVLLDLNTAEGAQLDLLGKIANEPRNGKSDADYRNTLRVWFSSTQSGTPEDILRTIREVTGLPGNYQYIPEYPAGYFIYSPYLSDLSQDLIDKISPAGVQGYVGCILVDSDWDPIIGEDGDYIMVAGPCDTAIISTEDDFAILSETGAIIELETTV